MLVGIVVLGRPGMALVVLSKVEQRLDAVRAVLSGATVTEVAAAVGVSRVSVHAWLRRYLTEGVTGLADRSHRPRSCPHQASDDVAVRVAEMRRTHPRWGAKRIRMELLKKPGALTVPSTATINRILIRHGLVTPRKRKRPRNSYQRWERPGPMQLWQLDIVGGVWLVDPATGVLREAKVVTGVDDHSRFCVIASVVERATGRAVCLAFAAALARFGVPDEILTDNGKQFTGRFGRGGEVLFDKICRHNGITHRLTQPASPTTTGKIERFHLTLRRELLDDHDPFESLAAAQAAVDEFVREYNADRPHQALDDSGRSPRRTASPRPASGARVVAALAAPDARCVRTSLRTNQPATPTRTAEPVTGSGTTAGYRGWGGGVRPGRPAGREPATRRPTVLARPGSVRSGRPVLGRRRSDPSVHRRHPDQDGSLAPVRDRPGPAGRRGCRGPPARPRCHRSNPATPSRSNGSSPAPAPSSWAATSSWPRRSSAAAGSGSASNATP